VLANDEQIRAGGHRPSFYGPLIHRRAAFAILKP
jgi:hypothetical protein